MPNLARVVLALAMLTFAVSGVNAKPAPAAQDSRGSLVIVFNDGRQQSFPKVDIARFEGTLARSAHSTASSGGPASVVIVFKDGHRQSFALADVASIVFKATTPGDAPLGRNHFIGKWRVGDGAGTTFYITLEANGDARKSAGASHGTWTVVENEARISWDDGWHDAIRKVGAKHEKFAYEPGKSFSDSPSNVTDARNTSPQPI